jgi:hypothetical protein
VQVEECKLPKDFIDLHIGDRALVGQFIKEDSSRAFASVQSWVVKYVDFLRRKVWLDMCMRNGEVSTHRDGWGRLGLGRDI